MHKVCTRFEGTSPHVSRFMTIWEDSRRRVKEKCHPFIQWCMNLPLPPVKSVCAEMPVSVRLAACGHTNCWRHRNGNSTLSEMLLAVCSLLHHPFHLILVRSAKPPLWTWLCQWDLMQTPKFKTACHLTSLFLAALILRPSMGQSYRTWPTSRVFMNLGAFVPFRLFIEI